MSKLEQQGWNIEQATKTYSVDRWGKGYFSIGECGNLLVSPQIDTPDLKIDIRDIVDEMAQKGIEFPAVIRFHDILRSQVKLLNQTFDKVIKEAEYQGQYFGVFPIKVNQMREVVEEIVSAGAPYNYGLEAGSKPELLAALAYNTNPNALTVLNGYKDEEYMRLALLGQQMGRNIIIVIEKFSELKTLIPLARSLNIRPQIGLRCKLMVKGQGKWEHSSGERAKFGLTYVEMLNAISLMEQEQLSDCIKLLHFHIGSQLTDIRAVKEAAQEASMVYVNLIKLGVPLEFVDVGGGLAVDYDGSQSSADSSRNYTKEEYVSGIVWGFKQSCDLNDVPHPNIVSESGRAVTAHHSCLITKIIGEVKPDHSRFCTAPQDGEHILLSNMREIAQDLTPDNMQEMLNELLSLKEQLSNAFTLGVVSLTELAKSEAIYWNVLREMGSELRLLDEIPQELMVVNEHLSSQYLANFSVFQSTIDCWAIEQLLPVMPISRLNELPTKQGSLVDITCDSDGKIDRFIDNETGNQTIPLHELDKAQDYYVGIFLTGAYQDVMGDMHNLFGRVNEAHIVSYDDDPKDYYIEEVVKGASMGAALATMQYNPDLLAQMVKRDLDRQVAAGLLQPRVGVELTDYYEEALTHYTYLKSDYKR